jgi:hypothetical protein
MRTGDDRQRIISGAYMAFRSVRKLPAGELCLAVVDLALRAGGQAPMDGDERRLVGAHVLCTWDKWQDGSRPEPIKPDNAWPGWPANATAAVPMLDTMPTAGIRGRATLWD